MNVSYKISFPDVEINSTHAHQGILDAIELLKSPEYMKLIKWEETHDDSCRCNRCLEEIEY